MRKDDFGIIHTLDEDIIRIWKAHGWTVTIITPIKSDKWVITAKYEGLI